MIRGLLIEMLGGHGRVCSAVHTIVQPTTSSDRRFPLIMLAGKFNVPFRNDKLHVNGLDFNVRESGSKQPALVFIHYWGGTGRTGDLVAESLSERHRCIAPDLRGWGRSDRMAVGHDLHVRADDIAAIVQSLELSRYILVGHSMGGKIAQILASRRPAGWAR